MLNKRIILSGLSIMASLAIMGGATYAFFSDSGTSTGNAFSTGSLDMKLSDANDTAVDNITQSFGIANGGPGSTFSSDIKVRNSGSVPANHIELKFANVVTEGVGVGSTAPLDSVIEITTFEWDSNGDGSTDVTIPVTDQNGNGISDLDDLENQVADDFDNLSFTGTQGNDHLLRINGRYSPTLMDNGHQGDTVDSTMTVTMNQDSSQ